MALSSAEKSTQKPCRGPIEKTQWGQLVTVTKLACISFAFFEPLVTLLVHGSNPLVPSVVGLACSILFFFMWGAYPSLLTYVRTHSLTCAHSRFGFQKGEFDASILVSIGQDMFGSKASSDRVAQASFRVSWARCVGAVPLFSCNEIPPELHVDTISYAQSQQWSHGPMTVVRGP